MKGYQSRMKERPESEELFMMYLLGELSEEDQARLEEVFLVDDGYYEQLLVAEDELRYDYAQGLLDPGRRQRFEKRFAVSPADREKLAFATALVSTLSAPGLVPPQATLQLTEALPSLFGAWGGPLVARDRLTGIAKVIARSAVWRPSLPKPWRQRLAARDRLTGIANLVQPLSVVQPSRLTTGPRVGVWGRFARIALGFAAIVLIAGVALIIVRTIRYQDQVKDLKRQVSLQRGFWSQTEEEAAPAASFILSPGLTRDSGEMKKPLIQTGEAERVRLQLNLKRAGDYQSYEALLKTAEGKLVWGQAGLRPGRFGPIQVIAITLLSRVIPPGEYHVELKGLAPGGLAEQVDDYYFSVANR
jgi:hypothetical protein